MTAIRPLACVLLVGLVLCQPGCVTSAMWRGYSRSVGSADELAEADDVDAERPAAGEPAARDVAQAPTADDGAAREDTGAGPADVALGALCVVATPATFAIDLSLAGLAIPFVPIVLLALL